MNLYNNQRVTTISSSETLSEVGHSNRVFTARELVTEAPIFTASPLLKLSVILVLG